MSKVLQAFIMLFLIATNSLAAIIKIESVSPAFVTAGQTMQITVTGLHPSKCDGLVVEFKNETFDIGPVNAQITSIAAMGKNGKRIISVLVPFINIDQPLTTNVKICTGNSGCSEIYNFLYLVPVLEIPSLTSVFPPFVLSQNPTPFKINGIFLADRVNSFTFFGSNTLFSNALQPNSFIPGDEIAGTLVYNALNLVFFCQPPIKRFDITIPSSSPNIYSPPGSFTFIAPDWITNDVEITSAVVENRHNQIALVVRGRGFELVKSFKIRFANNLFMNANNFDVIHVDGEERVVIALPSDLFEPSEGMVIARDQNGFYSNLANIETDSL